MSFFQFFKDARNELSHVVWPTKKESITYMYYTVGVIAVMAIILAIFGLIFKTGLKEAKTIINPNAGSVELSAEQIQDIVNNANNTEAIPSEETTTPTTESETNNETTPSVEVPENSTTESTTEVTTPEA